MNMVMVCKAVSFFDGVLQRLFELKNKGLKLQSPKTICMNERIESKQISSTRSDEFIIIQLYN